MNKKELNKNLVTLGLVSTLLFNTVGCTSNSETKVNSSESTSVSEKMETYITNDYYLIYLDENYYLTTMRYEKYYINDYSSYCFNYYDSKTKDLVGSVIGNALSDEKNDNGVVSQLYDYYHFKGEYGYGKIIPSFSIIPVSNIISSDKFTSDEFNFLSSNSEELHNTINNSIVYNTVDVVDYYTKKIGKAKPNYKEETLNKYVCETKNGNYDVLLGYRCSYNNKDLGYEYVYDILTGSIIYIGKNKENSYVNVQEYIYENSDNLSVLKDKFNNIEEKIKVSNTEEKLKAEYLYILDSTLINSNEYEFDYLTDNIEQLYYFFNTKERTIETKSLIFKDLFSDAEAWLAEDLLSLNYVDYNKDTIINYLQENNKKPYIKTINTYLTEVGREDLIKDEYTLEDIACIRDELMKLNNVKKLTM